MIVDNYEDILDSRDVIKRIADLEVDIAEATQAGDEPFEEDVQELTKLRALAEAGETLSDWIYGTTLVRDSYFADFAKQEAEETIDGFDELTWPFNHIDWDAAAEALQADYTEIDFDGVTYWGRS